MSHTVSVKVELRDRDILEAARKRLKLPEFRAGRHHLYGGREHDGLALQLPGWRYPVVINTETGQAVYDNFNGSWGKQLELDRLCQAYAVEAGTRDFTGQGFTVDEQVEQNGDVRLVATQY